MISEVAFVDELPEINYTDQFMVLNEVKEDLGKHWIEFAKVLIDIAFDDSSKHFRRIRSHVKDKQTPILILPQRAKDYLGLGRKYPVVEIGINKENNLSAIPNKTYDVLIQDFFTMKRGDNLMSIRSLIDMFLSYQWSKKRLLYPLTRFPDNLSRFEQWYCLVSKHSSVVEMANEWFVNTDESRSGAVKTRKGSLMRAFTATTWSDYRVLDEQKLNEIETMMSDYIYKENVYYQKTNFQRLVTNELRHMLIEKDIENIREPSAIAKERKLESMKVSKSIYERFDWVDTRKYPQIEETKKRIVSFIKYLENSGLAAATIGGKVTVFNRFLHFLIAKTSVNQPLSVQVVDMFFEPRGEKNILDYFRSELKLTETNALSYLYQIIQFFVFNEWYSATAKKNTPAMKAHRAVSPHRKAMPKEMVAHIVDILQNRPPKAPTKWSKDKADSSWWKFETYPVLPIIMLFQYCIPIRGEQARWLCRDRSFVYDETGENIVSFIITTDKNVNRYKLQEIPNVWESLDILVPFLKWHKEYFPNMKQIKYHNDDNSPWGNIVPVMNLANEYQPISNQTHMDYHKRILCQYQIEVAQQAEKEEKSGYPVVAKFKDGRPFFKSVDELNRAKISDIRKVEVVYDIHSIRVTGATRYLEAGVGVRTVMDLTGHMNAETLMRIYISLTRIEKERALKSAANKIFFGDKETLVENTQAFVSGELTDAFNAGELQMSGTLQENGLFSLYRKPSASQKTVNDLERGTDIALKSHPSLWRPMIHGLCPGVKCPEGRENKCSLCPYLITGRLFMDGIVHQLNNLTAAFQRESIWISEEKKKRGYDNHAKAEELETMLEEIVGWQEILEKINKDIHGKDEKKDSHVPAEYSENSTAFITKLIPEEIAYLENAYDAHLMGVEKDRYGMKVLTIKAMQIAAKKGDSKMLESIGKDELKAIDLLMEHYLDTVSIELKEDVKELTSSIGMLPQKGKQI